MKPIPGHVSTLTPLRLNTTLRVTGVCRPLVWFVCGVIFVQMFGNIIEQLCCQMSCYHDEGKVLPVYPICCNTYLHDIISRHANVKLYRNMIVLHRQRDVNSSVFLWLKNASIIYCEASTCTRCYKYPVLPGQGRIRPSIQIPDK